MHNVGICEAVLAVSERFGNFADDFKTETLPQFDGFFVALNDEVKLHRAIAEPFRFRDGKLAYFSANAFSSGFGRNHITAVGDVRTQTRLIRFDVKCGDDLIIRNGDE